MASGKSGQKAGSKSGGSTPGRPANAGKGSTPARPVKKAAGARAAAKARPSAAVSSGGEPPRGWRADEVVVGRISPAARAAGVVALAGALCLAVRPFLSLATVDGSAVGRTSGIFGLLGWVPAIGLLAVAGAGLLRGRLPRLWLATIASSGALALGAGLRVIWLLGSTRTVIDLPVGGQMLSGDRYDVAAGLVLDLAGLALLAAAAACALAAWAGTVMDDSGRFDGRRPRWGVASLLLGTVTAVAFAVPPSDAAVGLLAPSVIQRHGLDRIGAWVFIAAIVLCCVAAATLRPWLAVAGGLAGVAAMLLGWGVENLVVVLRSPDLAANWGTGMELALPALLAIMAAVALLLKAGPGHGDPDAGPGRPALGAGPARVDAAI